MAKNSGENIILLPSFPNAYPGFGSNDAISHRIHLCCDVPLLGCRDGDAPWATSFPPLASISNVIVLVPT